MHRTTSLIIVGLLITAGHCALFESKSENKFSGLKAIQDVHRY